MSENSSKAKPITKKDTIKQLEKDIVKDAIKIARNEVSSCYDMVIKTNKLISLYETD